MVLRVGGGEHAGGGIGGLGERRSLFEDGDASAAMMQLKGKRETDDASSGDADIGVLHEMSLVGFGKV